MATSPVQKTYEYILGHWQGQTIEGKKKMCNQLEHLTVLEKNAFARTVLEAKIRNLDGSIRLDIDQEIVWSYGRH